jgi:hypothetical protein
MNRSTEKPFLTCCALCLIAFCGIVFALCHPAFATDPQIDVKELARTQKSWDWGESIGPDPAHIIVFYAGQTDTPVTVTRKE